MGKKYYARQIESEIKKAANQFPVVSLTGPRQTGKTTTLKKLFPAYKFITLDDPVVRTAAIEDPALFIERAGFHCVIDEVQYAPLILPYLKIEVDKNRERNGLYILTGSQIFPLMNGISESLAGRIALFELLGFSLEELPISLPLSLNDLFRILIRGFFPDPSVHNVDTRYFYPSYIQTYLERDIRHIQNVQDLNLFQKFLGLLAARIGSLLNINEIAKECGISTTTAQRWLSLLETTRIIYLLQPFHGNLTKRLIKRPKLYFSDTGLAAYLLKYHDADILAAGPMAGQAFENFLVIEFLKYQMNHSASFELYFYRDSNHNEIDLVIDKGLTKSLVEIKLSKTPKKNHFRSMSFMKSIYPDAECFLLNLYEEELHLTYGTSLPYWEFAGILRQ